MVVCGSCAVGQRSCQLRHSGAVPEVLPGSALWAEPCRAPVPAPCPCAGLGVLGVHPQRWQRVLGTLVGGARLLATPLLRGSSCCSPRCEHTHRLSVLLGAPCVTPVRAQGCPAPGWPWHGSPVATGLWDGARGCRFLSFAHSSHSPILSLLSHPCGSVAGIHRFPCLGCIPLIPARCWDGSRS